MCKNFMLEYISNHILHVVHNQISNSRGKVNIMKTCGYCGNEYDEKEPKCPHCGSTLLKHIKGVKTAEEERERLKEEINRKRRTRSLILLGGVVAIVLVIVLIISCVVRFINDPQRKIAKESKALMMQAEKMVDDCDYDSAIDTLNQINSEWEDYSATNSVRQEAERGLLLDQIEEYQAAENYEELVAFIDENVTDADFDAEIQAIYGAAVQKCKENALAAVAKYTEAGNYLDAIQYIDCLGSSMKADTDIKSIYDQSVANYESSVISEAETFTQAGDYTSARSVLSVAENYLGKSEALGGKIAEINEREVTAQVLSYAEASNYQDAIVYLNKNSEIVSESMDLQAKLSTYTEKYRANILNEAARVFNMAGYEAAVNILNSALEVLPNDVLLNSEKAMYEAMKPILLTEMEIFSYGSKGKYNIDVDSHTEDRYANKYDTSFSVESEDTIKWWVNRNYEKFTGTIACPDGYTYQSNYSNVIVTIYCDGKKVFTSEEAGPEMKPQSFTIDLSGVEELSIKWHCLESLNIWHNWCAYGTIFDGKLYPGS